MYHRNGNLWFTDERSNSNMEIYSKRKSISKIYGPTKGGYPLFLVFDSNDKVWFTEILKESCNA